MQRRREIKLSERVAVPVAESMLTALQEIADLERITRAEVMRRFLTEGIEQYRERRANNEQRMVAGA